MLISSLEFSSVEMAVGEFARKSACKAGRAFSNVAMVAQFACESGCGRQCGKMYGPRGVSPTKGSSTGGIMKGDLKRMISYVSWLLDFAAVRWKANIRKRASASREVA